MCLVNILISCCKILQFGETAHFQLAQSFISSVKPALEKDLALPVEWFQIEDCRVHRNLDQPDSSKCEQNIWSRRCTEACMDNSVGAPGAC